MTKYRVLIVDDSRFMRQVLCDMVNADPSFTVIATAGDGEEAVLLVEQLEPDIVTMDMEMPRMNGLEALRRIMAVRSVPVIMLSAVTDNGMRDTIKALQYGAFDFVRKPDSTLNLDIREVCRYLLDKLRIAAESIRTGQLRMLPAVEEASDIVAPPPLFESESPPREAEPELPLQEPEPPLRKPEQDPPLREPEPELSPREPEPQAQAQQPPPEPPEPPKPEPPPFVRNSTTDRASRAAGPAPPGKRPDAGGAPPLDRKRAAPIQPANDSKIEIAAKDAKDAIDAKGKATKLGKDAFAPAADRRPPQKRREEPPPNVSRVVQVPVRKSHASSVFHQVVAIGTSTGGPRALHEVLTKLPADFPAPILVVQHMPPKFTRSLAQRLDSFSNIRVCEATHDDLLQTATAYIAPGGNHMTIARDQKGAWRIKISTDPLRNGHRPSVDVLFESLVGLSQLERHIVLMTGMGSDGAKGMKALKEDGVQTLIAESEETCVVYGMPRSAVELGAVHRELPLGQIGPALIREVGLRSKMTQT